MTDPIVDEVRKYRDNHARKFDYDMQMICDDLIANQGKHGQKVVSLNSQKMPTRASTLKNAPHF